MDEDKRVLLGACGLYCGACYHFRANFYDDDRLREQAELHGRDPQGFTCQGCRSDELYLHPGCAECEIRACADGRALLHCGLCADFPCERLWAFQSDGRAHHRDIMIELVRLRKKGPEIWLAEQGASWTCPCGEAFSWYDETCERCGELVASYGAGQMLEGEAADPG